ncbi:MAG: hypothetical protein DMF15_16125 [Verrucomicrobia bacterium]|nr:MAG: hypothetical protein DMF15_16125 [Verrucomicrobiota bacterium]
MNKISVMKFKTVFAIAIICFFVIGCKSKMAVDYNNIVVKDQQSLAKSMEQTEPQLKHYFFKKAVLNYFDYMKTIYTSYKNYGSESTPEGRIIGLAVISRVTNSEDKAIADMKQAQRIFAKDNGFKIQSSNQKQSGSLTASPANQ